MFMQVNVRPTVNVPPILPVTSLNTFRSHTDVRSVYYRAGRTQNGRTAITGYDTQVFAACANVEALRSAKEAGARSKQ
jgi:hypothetical protein